jgi:glycosyltransferase involved in cell wall biosynthesis
MALEHGELVDLHIVASHHLRRWMIERGAEPGRVAVSTINVDTQRFAPDPELRARARAELGAPDDQPVVLFAARLSGEKRASLAAEVLLRLRDEGHPFLALFAGGGEDMPWLRLFVARHRLHTHIRLLGPVPNARVRELLAAADVFFLPSAREGISLAIYEALAMGVAPLAADVGGQRELVTPECGILVPPEGDQAAAYTDALRRLLLDPELRREMGRAGRTRVEAHFALPAMVERTIELLDHAAALVREDPRPPVGRGAGLAAATLAIEHYLLETRLRLLAPMRLALKLRHSSFARRALGLRRVFGLRGRLDQALYVARREIMWRVKRALGRPYNQ